MCSTQAHAFNQVSREPLLTAPTHKLFIDYNF